MELKVNEVQIPDAISFNYDELKQELAEKVSMYETMVYTEEQIKEAKADKASLNKLKKALNDERIKREREYMKPFNEFKSKVNEIINIIDKPVQVIDKQVKEFEEKQKNEKMAAIKEYWNGCEHPDCLSFEQIFDNKWLNASTSMKKIRETITEAIQQFSNDMATLATLPEYGFEAQQTYISTLDIGKAINEANRLSEMAKKKAETQAKEAEKKAVHPTPEFVTEPPIDEPDQPEEAFIPSFDEVIKASWIGFKANMTQKQVEELVQFFAERDIQYTLVD